MPIPSRILWLALLAGCASQPLSPVPVESRTRPAPQVTPSAAAVPRPTPAPAVQPPTARAEPVRPSGVQIKPLAAPGSADKPPGPPTKEASGAKRPSVEAQAAESAARAGTGMDSSPAGAGDARESPKAAQKAEPKAEPKAEGKPEARSEPGFIWPARGRVIQSFSEPKNMGIAIAGNPGDPVQAVADGRVIFSGPGPRGYGNLLILKHDTETLSVYAHNRALLVKEGAQVRRGQQIAELGESGTDRPKLHFEIRRSGKPVDPVKLLPSR